MSQEELAHPTIIKYFASRLKVWFVRLRESGGLGFAEFEGLGAPTFMGRVSFDSPPKRGSDRSTTKNNIVSRSLSVGASGRDTLTALYVARVEINSKLCSARLKPAAQSLVQPGQSVETKLQGRLQLNSILSSRKPSCVNLA